MPKDWGSRSTDSDPGRGLPGDRGTSEIIGVVLLFGMVLAGISVVAVSGMNAADQAKNTNDFEAATMSMKQLRSEMNGMAYANESKQRFEFAAHQTEKVGVSQDGYISFSVNRRSGCTAKRSMGMVKYQQDDGDVLAYEANAIWKDTGGDPVMVAPPKFEYRNKTIHGAVYRTFNYPLVNVNATLSHYGRSSELSVEDVGDMRAEMEEQMCLRGRNASKIEEVDNVTIKISGSQFHEGWADHFRETFDGIPVHHYPSNRTVVATLPLGRVNDSSPKPDATFFAEREDGHSSSDYLPVNKTETVFFFASATDPYDPDRAMQSRWMTLPDGSGSDFSVNATTVTYNWSTPGNKTVEFTAVNEDNKSVTKTVTVHVRPGSPGGGPPVPGSCTPDDPDASLEAETPGGTVDDESVTVDAGETVTFHASDSEGDDCGPGDQIRLRKLVGYDLDVNGNGTASHSWSTPGRYNVTYYVMDNEGNVSVARVQVTVKGSTVPGGGGHSDRDGDGVPDSIDDCPYTAGDGENGCAALVEESDGLRVNQSSGTLRVLGSQVTQRNVTKGANRKTMDVMFVLDGTGSMDDNDPDEQRVDATQGFLDQLNASAGDRAGWVQFRIRRYRCYHDQIYEACAKLKQGLTGDLDAVSNSVENVDQNGATYIGAGIDKATGQLESSSNDEQIIVLLTDGKNDYSGWEDVSTADLNQRTVDRAQDAADAGITIYPVGLGDGADESLLSTIASETGGTYYQVDDAGELEDVFGKIAGHQKEPKRFVEFENTTTTIEVADSPDPKSISLGNVNDPTGSGGASKDLDQGEPGWLLSLNTTFNRCDGRQSTGSKVEYGGETYNETTCTGSTPVESVDGDDANHRIYLDGDAVPTFQGDANKPWKSSVGRIVRQYDDSLVQGGEFDLGPNQAVIVTRFSPGNVTVSLFAADDTPPSSPGCGVTNPPNANLAVSPSTVVRTGTNVDFSGSAHEADPCGIGAPIQGESLTGEGPGGTAFSVNHPHPHADHTWSSPGTYQVNYQYDDNDRGGPYVVSKQVVVLGNGNCADGMPTASVTASKTNVTVGEQVHVEGHMSDGDACGTGFESYDLSGSEGVVQTNDSRTATGAWLNPGVKTIDFVVTDDEGNTVTASVTVDVHAPPNASGNPLPDDGFVIGIGGDEVVIGVDD